MVVGEAVSVENAETVEATVATEAAEVAGSLIDDLLAETRVHHLRGAGHHHAVSVTYMSRAVVVVEDAAVIARETVARPLAAGLVLHRLDAPAAPLLPTVRAHHQDAGDAHPPAVARDLHHGDQGGRLLLDVSEGTVDGTGRGPLATTAAGYPGIHLDLLPQKRKRAHQHPGCQGHDPARRRAAAAAQGPAVHGL